MTDDIAHVTDEELLAAATGELRPHRSAAIDQHLASCAACAARAAALQQTADVVRAALRDEADAARMDDIRERLALALKREPMPPRAGEGLMLAGLAAALAALVMAILWLQPLDPSASAVDLAARPVPTLTPGAAAITRADVLCSGAASGDSPIPAEIRDEVIASYGMQNVPPEDYELDYLITPELGGALDARNLWPQRYNVRGPWNALVKDELERLLPRLVCSGRVDLTIAQQDMASDWIAAYRKYFRTRDPLRIHVRAGKTHAADRLVLGILPPKS